MMRYTIRYVSLLAGMLTVFSSCEHKDLCFDHEAHAPKSDVHVKAVYETVSYTHLTLPTTSRV